MYFVIRNWRADGFAFEPDHNEVIEGYEDKNKAYDHRDVLNKTRKLDINEHYFVMYFSDWVLATEWCK